LPSKCPYISASLKAIVALGEKGEMGFQSQLPWHIPEDLRYFKQVTLGHTLVMGRKTFDSFTRPLPNRSHWILSSSSSKKQEKQENQNLLFLDSWCLFWGSFWSFFDSSSVNVKINTNLCWAIGGRSIYQYLLPFCSSFYLTRIQASFPKADCFFPFSFSEIETMFICQEVGPWQMASTLGNNIAFRFEIWENLLCHRQ